jgi:hypothetical protein
VQGFEERLSCYYDEQEELWPGSEYAQGNRVSREQFCAELSEFLSKGVQRDETSTSQESAIKALLPSIADKNNNSTAGGGTLS